MLVLMPIPAGDRQLVQIVDAALNDAARRAGDWLVCRLGCTQCCHGVFAINALDALRLQAGVRALRASEPELAVEIDRRAQSWIDEHRSEFPGDPSTGALGETDTEREQFEEFADEAPCPALDPTTGRCDVYAWRPMTCRVFGPPVPMDAGTEEAAGLGHCELCFHGASESEVKACEMTVPHEFEEQLLRELTDTRETVVAFALVGWQDSPPR